MGTGSDSFFSDFVEQVVKSLPQGLQDVKEDLDQHMRHTLHRFLEKADLVTREEFDIQKQVLQRTTKRLKLLEKQLKLWEEQQAVPLNRSSSPKANNSKQNATKKAPDS